MTAAGLDRTDAPRTRRRRRISGWHFVLAPIALVFLTPFLQMVMASLSPASA